MPAQQTETPHINSPWPLPVTLQPLLDDGPDALDVTGFPDIKGITLNKVVIATENAFDQKTILVADDLFKAAAAAQQIPPIPQSGKLACATFGIHLNNASTESLVICPPDKIQLSEPALTHSIILWLARKGFAAQRLLPSILLIISLVLVFIPCLPAPPDAPDLDDDDDDNHPKTSRIEKNPVHPLRSLAMQPPSGRAPCHRSSRRLVRAVLPAPRHAPASGKWSRVSSNPDCPIEYQN